MFVIGVIDWEEPTLCLTIGLSKLAAECGSPGHAIVVVIFYPPHDVHVQGSVHVGAGSRSPFVHKIFAKER